MYSETTKELLKAVEHVESLRAELAAKKQKKAAAMEKLNYRFPSSAKSGCLMLSDKLSDESVTWSESEIARAAMYLGLKQINEVLEDDRKRAKGLMHIIKIRAALGK